MSPVKIKTETTTKVTINGVDVEDVIQEAANLAHFVLEELSIYRQRKKLDPLTFDCEGEACAFLDLIGD